MPLGREITLMAIRFHRNFKLNRNLYTCLGFHSTFGLVSRIIVVLGIKARHISQFVLVAYFVIIYTCEIFKFLCHVRTRVNGDVECQRFLFFLIHIG